MRKCLCSYDDDGNDVYVCVGIISHGSDGEQRDVFY